MNLFTKLIVNKMHIMNMQISKKTIFLILVFLSSMLLLSESMAAITLDELLKRLDPHGKDGVALTSESAHKKSECQTCHASSKERLLKSGDTSQFCLACHNSMPHSGLIEHLGKDLGVLKVSGLSGKVNCLSCHRAHRARMPKEKEVTDVSNQIRQWKEGSIITLKRSKELLPVGLVERRSFQPMLQRACTDCHSWDRLK